MKIGLLCNFYGFPQYTDKVLAAWKNIPEVSVVAVSSYKYKDYANFGWDVDDTETPVQLLTEHREFVDYISIGKDGDDSSARNPALFNILDNHNVDCVWLLDQDEIYSEEDIKNTLDYLAPLAPKSPTYRINFKNFVFSEDQYIENFIAPRIFGVNVDGLKTLNHFYYENDVNYVIDGQIVDYKELGIEDIPKEVCFPNHYSWVGSPEFLKAKIKHQEKRYDGYCSYKWNEKKAELEFNKAFYKKTNQKIPTVKTQKK
tara:strand:+ start:2514 stop:3287 length:774 start_codon:yes stop_codon:yes gene_type:complete